ncbi:MAG TPA: hypothetical protein VGJ25_10035 [Gaiellaceae bacterium]
MPVVLPIPVVLVALFMLLLALVATVVIVALLERVEFEVPHVGHIHIPGVGRIARAVENTLREWVAPHLRTLAGWFDALASAVRGMPHELGDFATATVRWLDHGFHVTVHEIVRAFLRPVRELAADAKTLALAATAELVDLRGDARAWVNGAIAAAAGELADLRGYLLRRLADVHADVMARVLALRAVVVDDVLPRLGGIELELPDLRAWLRRLDDWIGDARAWFLPIAAVFSGAAALALLEHVRGCRHASDRLCNTDPDFLEGLLGLSLALFSIAELQAFVRTTAGGAGELLDEFLVR